MPMVFHAVQFCCYQLWYNNVIVIVNFPLLSDWSGLDAGITSITLTASRLLAPCKHSKRLYCSQENVLPGPCVRTKSILKQDLSNSFPCISFVLPAVYFASQRQQHIQNASMKGVRAACLDNSNFAGKCTSLLTHEVDHKLENSWLEK